MGKSVHNEETKKLMEGILKLQSVDECYAFFEDLCTVNELLSLGQRFEVANMLRNHKTYNEVAEATGPPRDNQQSKSLPELWNRRVSIGAGTYGGG